MSDEDSRADWERSGRAVRRAEQEGYERGAKDATEVSNEANRPTPSSGSRRSITRHVADTGTVAGLVIFATAFSLVGNEIRTVQGAANPAGAAGGFVTESGRIIIGGFMAGGILMLISNAGEGGRELGVGLALVLFVSSTLVYGKPVWDAISKIVGGKPTGTTGATSPTKPTGGTK